MTNEQIAVFALTCIGFGFIPGPALLQTVSLTLQHGQRAGMISALGIHLGSLFQVGVVAIGAVAVLKTSPGLYHVLKLAAGGYLFWLGIQRIRARATPDEAAYLPRNILASSALIEALNPKSALFYFSFLLQFTAPDSSLGLGWQVFLLGICANVLFSLSDVACIFLAHPLRERLEPGGRFFRACQWTAGMLFITLGVLAIVQD